MPELLSKSHYKYCSKTYHHHRSMHHSSAPGQYHGTGLKPGTSTAYIIRAKITPAEKTHVNQQPQG